MPSFHRRRILILSAAGLFLAGGAVAIRRGLSGRLEKALDTPARAVQPLSFIALPVPTAALEHWGGGQVEGVAAAPGALYTAGGSGVWDGADLGAGLPSLHASALALWRGHPVVGLAAGGLFLRREGRWEEARSGHGLLHVRCLQESPGGELWIGAQEGLFRAAWGATTLERFDGAPVRSLALGGDGLVLAAGETGLRQVEGARIKTLPSPDPWVDWVGLSGSDVAVITPLGLARGPLGQPLLPQQEGGEARSAAWLGGSLFAAADRALLRYDDAGRVVEEPLPAAPRRVFASAGILFADTDAGLWRRREKGWNLERPHPAALPPGPCHITALALQDTHLVAGLFDGGLAVRAGGGWSTVPGSTAWGVNALLPAGGALYVASLRGAARLEGGRLVPLPDAAEGAAFSLADTGRGVAVGFGQGLQLPGPRFLSAFHGLPGNQALAILRAGGELFVGTPTGLGAVVDGKVAWRVTAGEDKLPNPWITALLADGDGVLVGTYGGGVARRLPPKEGAGPGRFTPYTETGGLKVNPGCLARAGGRVFLGTDGRGLFRLDPGAGRFLPLHLPLPSARITALLPDGDALFVGTEEGLARLPLSLALQEP